MGRHGRQRHTKYMSEMNNHVMFTTCVLIIEGVHGPLTSANAFSFQEHSLFTLPSLPIRSG